MFYPLHITTDICVKPPAKQQQDIKVKQVNPLLHMHNKFVAMICITPPSSTIDTTSPPPEPLTMASNLSNVNANGGHLNIHLTTCLVALASNALWVVPLICISCGHVKEINKQ